MIIPPYAGVRLVEYNDRIALKPVANHLEIVGLCKIEAANKDFKPWDGFNPFMLEALRHQMDVWCIIQWNHYEDGKDEIVAIEYITDATDAEALDNFKVHVEFLKMPKEELQQIEKLFVVPEDDRDYIADRFPETPPNPKNRKEHDLYQARLKVLAAKHPKAVALMEQAAATEDLKQRSVLESEAVSAYYAEMAHYWRDEEVTAWQRSNPILPKWINEFASVFKKPKKDLDPVDHALVLDWLKRDYNQLTAGELAEIIFQKTGQHLTPEAIKKRRERLGLTTERPCFLECAIGGALSSSR